MPESIAFDRAAGYYDATRGFAPAQEAAIAAALIAALGPPTGPVLELGIGTGRIAIPVQQQGGYAYYGIDLARPMLEKLRENAAARSDHPFRLVQGDSDLVPALEQALPAAFGGGPTDYQLVEDQSGAGLAQLCLLIHPRVGPLEPTAARMAASRSSKTWTTTASINASLSAR